MKVTQVFWLQSRGEIQSGDPDGPKESLPEIVVSVQVEGELVAVEAPSGYERDNTLRKGSTTLIKTFVADRDGRRDAKKFYEQVTEAMRDGSVLKIYLDRVTGDIENLLYQK